MTELSEGSIADAPAAPAGAAAIRRLPLLLAAAALLWGAAAAAYYAAQGLTLSHYDAKAHLVVARRILDSLTPGWVQIGAVWLPLPHLINMLPVQVDAWYRSGLSAVIVSVASFALLIVSAVRLNLQFGRWPAAALSAVLLAANPNLLYLQSTPMTEPLLLGLLGLAIAELTCAVDEERSLTRGSVVLMLAVMTRYEAWPAAAAIAAGVALARWRQGRSAGDALRDGLRAVRWPIVAMLWFFVHSRLTVGEWFVTGGFYVPDPQYLHRPHAVAYALWHGTRVLGSAVLAVAAPIAAVWLALLWARRRIRPAAVIALAWTAVGALPAYAFFQGHPFRVRYMVPLVTAAAVLVPLAIDRLARPRIRTVAAVLLLAGVLSNVRPFDSRAAMVLEAQWDRPKSLARQQVTACLPAPDGTVTVLASMGSLAHYMQELSHRGFAIRDFLHEGNGELWAAAVGRPRDHVRWILIEEVSEGGDVLAQRARRDPAFLDGFVRACEAAGVVLYRRE